MTSTGPEPEPPVWKIYDAIDRTNGKVMFKWSSPILLKTKTILPFLTGDVFILCFLLLMDKLESSVKSLDGPEWSSFG